MMKYSKIFDSKTNLAELLLALLVILGLIWTIIFFSLNGYLPIPFFYEPSDTWMDWFNPTYWAYDEGRYDTWGAVYPPLSFVILRIFSLSSCYPDTYYLSSRSCDWIGSVTLHLIYLINVVLISFTFIKLNKNTALARAITLSISCPMLFALERGNLILLTFTCILLGYGPLLKSARLRWIAVGLSINFKVYLIAALFPQLIRRRWRWFEGAMIVTILIYIITYIILSNGSPIEIYNNIYKLNTESSIDSFLSGWYPSTYKDFLSLLQNNFVPVIIFLGSDAIEISSFALPALQLIVQTSIVLAFFAAWLRPEIPTTFRLTNLGISLAIITAESSGYSQFFIILFVFMERWRGFGVGWAIFVAYVLCIPVDFAIDRTGVFARDSFLAGHQVLYETVLPLGPFVRPLLLMSIPFALSCVTIREVWDDIQKQGWKLRWRYRYDAPIMVGSGTASPPAR